MKKILIIAIAFAFAVAAEAVETSLAYQGVLKDGAGASAITGARQIKFRLYTAATGGTPLWAREVNVNLDDAGLFNVELTDAVGSAVSGAKHENLADALREARSGNLFIGLEVAESTGEILPRQKILMTPYASWAADVTHASGAFSVDGKATLASAEVSGAMRIAGDASFDGKATFSKGLTVTGGLNAQGQGISGYGTFPLGGIIMWSGPSSAIPDGWAVCDGTTKNGYRTPDLRNRFILGGTSAGAFGGSTSVTITVDNLPSHSHLYAGDDQISYIKDSNYDASKNVVSLPGHYDASSSDSGHGTIYRTSATGGGQPISIMPTYYTLVFIMRVK